VSALSTHILDTVRGEPASGIVVRLERADPAAGFAQVAQAVTDADGRVADFGVAGPLSAGTYRLVFSTGAYLSARHPGGAGEEPFFPEVVLTFTADGRRPRYHVPLLLSPFSYSTYRGS
jgi:5-hydroxyisourate hydrolase